MIPAAAMTRAGRMYIGVFGIKDTAVVTSTLAIIDIMKGAISGDTVSTEPTDDVFLAIIAQYQRIAELMRQYEKTAEQFNANMEEQNRILETINAFDVLEISERLDVIEERMVYYNNLAQALIDREVILRDVPIQFVDGVCEIKNELITADSLCDVYFDEYSYEFAAKALIMVSSYDGFIRITCSVNICEELNANILVRGGVLDMLGKTNITTIKSGIIVSDVAEYEWNSVGLSDVMGTFVKVIYENDILIGITKDGEIVYTKDGDNWEKRTLELEDKYVLNDLIWDGKRFVFVGSHTDNSEYISALVAVSENLIDFDVKTKVDENEYLSLSSVHNRYTSFLCVTGREGAYNIVAVHLEKSGTSGLGWEHNYYAVNTDLESFAIKNFIFKHASAYTGSEKEYIFNIFNSATINFSKSGNRIIAYIKCLENITSSLSVPVLNKSAHYIIASQNGQYFNKVLDTVGEAGDISDIFAVFGCKGNQYYISMRSALNYKFVKLSESGENSDITTGVDFGFVDAVYFNKCEIYINDHQMLVVRNGENISDKTLEDFIEITYDFSMTTIVKAFNKLYVFGSGGNIMASSNEIKNEEALSVQTMSAIKALYDAKIYADKRYAELEDRVVKIEEKLYLNQQS